MISMNAPTPSLAKEEESRGDTGDSIIIKQRRKQEESQYQHPIDKKNSEIKKKISQLLEKHKGGEDDDHMLPRIEHKSLTPQDLLEKERDRLERRSLNNSVELDPEDQKAGKRARLKVYGATFELKTRA